MSFVVHYQESVVKKDIPALSGGIRAIIKKAIEKKLTISPQIYGKPLRFTLKDLWSLRVGNYRIIYQIKNNMVVILKIGHCREVYS